jgi:hypothetical protein
MRTSAIARLVAVTAAILAFSEHAAGHHERVADTERTIHMDRTVPPADAPASMLGYSVERYSLSDDQTRLDFHVIVNDPVTLTSPAVLVGQWLALGETIAQFDCRARASP